MNFDSTPLNSLENGLGMYASSFCTMSAESLYDSSVLSSFRSILDISHIYLIGYVEEVKFRSVKDCNNRFEAIYDVCGEQMLIEGKFPEGFNLIKTEDNFHFKNAEGESTSLNVLEHLKSLGKATFHIEYIGQAFGKNGSRKAYDRLINHETLLQISIKGVPKGYALQLMTLPIERNSHHYVRIDPKAENHDNSFERYSKGAKKVLNLSDSEQVSLYEAALIRYFKPKYNKEFKKSFPSTNHKILEDCYQKDFSLLVAEICIDEMPFLLKSDMIEPSLHHIAKFDLQQEDKKRLFFSL